MSQSRLRLDELVARLDAASVVGAGGAGFPVAEKLKARAYHTLIVNAAQSEPLIYKDWAVLAHYPDCVLDGARRLADSLGLGKTLLAVRDEFLAHLPGLAARARAFGVTVARLPDLYPLGYEKLLKREVLGVPPGGEADDILVLNAETVRNVSWALRRDWPVCTKLLTVAGAVRRPLSLSVPLGTSFADCLAQAEGAACAHYAVFRNGVLSGACIDPDSAWVDATTLGFVVLPLMHSAVTPPRADDAMQQRLAERRAAFFTATSAGRPQAMSAVYALFDLTRYHRARFDFRAARAADSWPQRVHLSLVGAQAQAQWQPDTVPGAQVTRGQVLALHSHAHGGRLHASVDGVIESVDASGVTILRRIKDGQP